MIIYYTSAGCQPVPAAISGISTGEGLGWVARIRELCGRSLWSLLKKPGIQTRGFQPLVSPKTKTPATSAP